MSYSVYRTCMCVEEQKVLKCDRVNQRGSHNKIHHTEEDIGKLVVLKRVILNHRGREEAERGRSRTSSFMEQL
ncbi:hypothetical protein IGI04_006197 [Brassica rapa subsp. trilocularis]|uniref:Uncharacterized protein n=1 Tax=Brassica rapa subsp. trilocularis TaxID=1813537 RepID=A0ABQ7NG52_BRACM|nr:hypothetical protein IGI04_006197 [Brassica rapa subsp. trilocularis]